MAVVALPTHESSAFIIAHGDVRRPLPLGSRFVPFVSNRKGRFSLFRSESDRVRRVGSLRQQRYNPLPMSAKTRPRAGSKCAVRDRSGKRVSRGPLRFCSSRHAAMPVASWALSAFTPAQALLTGLINGCKCAEQ